MPAGVNLEKRRIESPVWGMPSWVPAHAREVQRDYRETLRRCG